MQKFIVAPSILTANFLNLGKELEKLEKAGIEWIHYDVMDYNFVPNLSFGTKILEDITNKFNFKIDVHLMVKIENFKMEDYLNSFIFKNIQQLTMHFESLTPEQIEEFISFCINKKLRSSIAINPDTNVEVILKYLNKLDNVLIMSVYPGFGGQSFITKSLEKLRFLKNYRDNNNLVFSIQVDGGINETTYKLVQLEGVDIIVAGSYLVGGNILNLEERVKKLKSD
ncbi:ribulose-phosphate 3-epimerase [Spiroplasma taiwanense]|uniref:Ribulose-phosphate 3-epimerase n=1 Tax=Spiroplasma taiwanense CT-1 TaxID=1276220 RepID=S5M0J8_9MOLU|nr:ribulose-phosphate 3-epimerase [Spiroplasma taiwanense]AGR41522.1 ribulose-phosphate 3-epimerase [Spiroplasma taiwanense CT-1]